MLPQAAPPARLALITGGNSGLGFCCAGSVAQIQGWTVVIACRDEERAAAAVRKLRAETHNEAVSSMPLDLASLQSVRAFAATYQRSVESGALPRASALVLNAGVGFAPPSTTKDGFEMTFGVNHLGHFLLLQLLFPLLQPDARVIIVASDLHDPEKKPPGLLPPKWTSAEELSQPWKPEKGLSDFDLSSRAYANSKLANVYTTYEAVRRLKDHKHWSGIHLFAYEPGFMPTTNLGRHASAPLRFISHYVLPLARPFMSHMTTPSISGDILARLACNSKYSAENGKYYELTKAHESSKESYDEGKARDLWEASLKLVGLVGGEEAKPNL